MKLYYEDKLLGGPLGFVPDNQFGRDYLSKEIKEYNILRLRNELNTFNNDFSKELDKHYSEGELIDIRNHSSHPYAWAVDKQIQIFADYFNICVAVWQDKQYWNLFVPQGSQSLLGGIHPEYETFNKCISNNIIYIYNANYGHYFLIEPKETQRSRVNNKLTEFKGKYSTEFKGKYSGVQG